MVLPNRVQPVPSFIEKKSPFFPLGCRSHFPPSLPNPTGRRWVPRELRQRTTGICTAAPSPSGICGRTALAPSPRGRMLEHNQKQPILPPPWITLGRPAICGRSRRLAVLSTPLCLELLARATPGSPPVGFWSGVRLIRLDSGVRSVAHAWPPTSPKWPLPALMHLVEPRATATVCALDHPIKIATREAARTAGDAPCSCCRLIPRCFPFSSPAFCRFTAVPVTMVWLRETVYPER